MPEEKTFGVFKGRSMTEAERKAEEQERKAEQPTGETEKKRKFTALAKAMGEMKAGEVIVIESEKSITKPSLEREIDLLEDNWLLYTVTPSSKPITKTIEVYETVIKKLDKPREKGKGGRRKAEGGK